VAATGDQGEIRLQPGESMVITGLSRQISTSDRNGFAEEVPIVLGGSKKRGYSRESFLIVVRAVPF
jgi:Flp pilus assembly secretin CpaC